MITIPKQLQQEGIRFVKLKPKEKVPFERDWQKKGCPHDDISLVEHLKTNGNYGVIGGGEKKLLIVDFDNQNVQEEAMKSLPKTLVVQTGSGMKHLYFLS